MAPILSGNSSISSFSAVTVRRPAFVMGMLLAGELVTRLAFFGPAAVLHPGRYSPEGAGQVHMVMPLADRTIGYRLRPLRTAYQAGVRLSTNRHGFRERNVPLKKPEGVIRLAVLGASFTMGGGVPDEQIYSRQLQRLFEASAPGRYQVLNFAVAGYNHLQMAASYEAFVKPFEPDVVLVPVQYGELDDTVPAQFAFPDKTVWDFFRRLVHNVSFLHRFVQVSLRSWLARRGAIDWHSRGRDGPREDVIRVEQVLSEFVARRAAERIPVVLVSLQRVRELPVEQAWHRDRLAQWVSNTPWSYLIDTHPALRGRVSVQDRIYPGDDHPNARVHRLYAEVIYRELLPILAAALPQEAHGE